MYSTPRRATSPRLDRSGGRLDRSGGRLDRSDRRLLAPRRASVYGNYLDRSTAYGANYTLGGTRIVDRRTFTRDVPVTVIEQEEFEVTTHQEPDEEVTHLEYVDRTEYETQLERVERTEYQPVTDEIVVTKTRMSTGLVEDSYTLLEETKEPVIVYQDVETTVPVTVTDTVEVTEYIPGKTYEVTQPIGTSLSHYSGSASYIGSPAFSDGGSPYRRAASPGSFRKYPKAGGVSRAASPSSRFGGGSPSRTFRRPSPAKRVLDYSPRRVAGSPRRLRATSPSRFDRSDLRLSPVARSRYGGGSVYLGSPHASLRERESGWAV